MMGIHLCRICLFKNLILVLTKATYNFFELYSLPLHSSRLLSAKTQTFSSLLAFQALEAIACVSEPI